MGFVTVLMVVLASGLVAQVNGESEELAGAAAGQSPLPEVVESARGLALFLGGILLLTVIFITGVFILRALHRARQRLMREPGRPTEYVDAWKLHRLPEDVEGGEEE